MATPKTNPEPIPGFDAVAESRKWREATSRVLSAMSREERVAYLHAARERYLAGRAAEESGQVKEEASCIVREEPPAS
jgi:hypothetical protein